MKNRISWLILMAFIALSACKKDDPCENISCLNGGTCANGACNCPEGYEGSNCSQQTTPLRINIRSIEAIEFPATTPNGASWDFVNGADVYVQLSLNGIEIANNRNSAYTNELAPVSWPSLPTGFEMTEVTNQYTLAIWDKDDLPPDQYLGAINFTPYSSVNGFPNTLDLSCSGCNTSFKIVIDYDF